MPGAHHSLAPHRTPHAPQFETSVFRSTQLPLLPPQQVLVVIGPMSGAPGHVTCEHVPSEQMSAVQAMPSLVQGTPSRLAYVQPVEGEQEPLTHGFALAHDTAAPPPHAPALQLSPVVHMLPSLHVTTLFTC